MTKEALNTLYEFTMADEKLSKLFRERAMANAESVIDAKSMVASALGEDNVTTKSYKKAK